MDSVKDKAGASDKTGGDGEFSEFDIFLTHIFGGGTMAQWEGRSPEALKIYHFAGIKLYNSGRYDEAHRVFHELVRLDHSNAEYTFCLAACLQKKKKYVNAANVYLSCIFLDPSADNVEVAFHIAECLIAANTSLDRAEEYLEHVIERCPDNDEMGHFKSIAEAKLELLRSKRSKKNPAASSDGKSKSQKKKKK